MGGVQAVVGQHQQLRLQCLAAFGDPQRHIALLPIERLQTRQCRRVDARRKAGAHAGQLREGLLDRAGWNHR